MATRDDPFADANKLIDVSDFAQDPLTAKRKDVDQAKLSSLARATGFDRSMESPASVSSPQPGSVSQSLKQRRYTTGRDTQLNLKCKAETKARFIRIADARQTTLGALFEQMLNTYEKQIERVSPPSSTQPSTTGTQT